MALWDSGRVDVVQIVPEVSLGQAEHNERPEIQVYSRTVNPNAEAWGRSLAYGKTNIINQQILTQEANQAQEKAREVSASLRKLRANSST